MTTHLLSAQTPLYGPLTLEASGWDQNGNPWMFCESRPYCDRKNALADIHADMTLDPLEVTCPGCIKESLKHSKGVRHVAGEMLEFLGMFGTPADAETVILPYLADPDPRIRHGAVLGLAHNAGEHSKVSDEVVCGLMALYAGEKDARVLEELQRLLGEKRRPH